MKKVFLVVAVAGFVGFMSTPAFALKQFNDVFKKMYAGEDAKEELKTLISEARCNVCHVQRENKKEVRNPYGEALHEMLEEEKFPVADFKKDPEKYAEQVEKIFKAIEKKESGYEKLKTFKDRMDANLLPGGNTDGKKDE